MGGRRAVLISREESGHANFIQVTPLLQVADLDRAVTSTQIVGFETCFRANDFAHEMQTAVLPLASVRF